MTESPASDNEPRDEHRTGEDQQSPGEADGSGVSRWRIRRTMLDESLMISLAGSLAGIAAGLLVGAFWVLSIRESTLVGLELRIPAGILIVIGLLGLLIGTMAAILPARRAARLDPLEALTYE